VAEIIFGPFSLDFSATRLLRDGQPVRLRPQALAALRALLRHSGDTVRYEQMIAEAWDGTVVSRHTVDVTVSEVRRSLGEFGTWIVNRPKLGYSIEVPKSDEQVRKGWHFYNRRTREGFEHAIDCFDRAARECPSDFRTLEGLAASYLALAIFGMRPPRQMYASFLQAHERAIAIGGMTPELRCHRAQGLHMFERRFAEAEAEFLQTMREDPALGSAYVRLAMLYASLGRSDEAIELLGRGYLADPLLPTLPVMEINVRYWRREYDVALEAGARAVELHPYLQVGRGVYAQVLERVGRFEEALTHCRTAIAMSPELTWLRAQEATCLARQERRAEALAILAQLDALRQSEYVDACYMAVLCEALGQRERAFDELARAREENSAWLYSLDVDPKMDPFRGDPRFGRLLSELYKPAAVRSS
jgi:DNA-binding winged helix-turn-helix (wHTH) protein/Flp pilus assembly protein TadD